MGQQSITRQIAGIYKEGELDNSTTENSSVVQTEGKRQAKRNVNFYNLDIIISVGYRVRSKMGILFRKWASKVLKDNLIQGYTVNQKRIQMKWKSSSN